MDKYVVIEEFIDGEDDRITYPVNAVYHREGYEPTKERINTLASSNNAKGTPLIRKLIELPAKEVKQVENNPQDPATLDRDAIKAELDVLGVTYAKNAKTETLLEILEASKLGE